MREYRNCAVCGNLYVATRTDSKTCNKVCSRVWNKIQSKRANEKVREQQKQDKLKKTMVNDIAVEARKAGMSYGQYVAKMGL